MLGAYTIGVVATGIIGLVGTSMYAANQWMDAQSDLYDTTRQQAARRTLTCLVALPIAVLLWPLAVLVGTVFGVGYLLRTAELPTPRLRRRPNAERIEELERELGMGQDHRCKPPRDDQGMWVCPVCNTPWWPSIYGGYKSGERWAR